MYEISNPINLGEAYRNYQADFYLEKISYYSKLLSANVIVFDEMMSATEELRFLQDILEQKLYKKSTWLGYIQVSHSKDELAAIKRGVDQCKKLILKIEYIKNIIIRKNTETKKELLDRGKELIPKIFDQNIFKIIINYTHVNNKGVLRRVCKKFREIVDNSSIVDTYILVPPKYFSKKLILNMTNLNRLIVYKEYIALLNVSKYNIYPIPFCEKNPVIASLNKNMQLLTHHHDKQKESVTNKETNERTSQSNINP